MRASYGRPSCDEFDIVEREGKWKEESEKIIHRVIGRGVEGSVDW